MKPKKAFSEAFRSNSQMARSRQTWDSMFIKPKVESTQSRLKILRSNIILDIFIYLRSWWVGSCKYKWIAAMKVNCRLKVNCRKKIWAGLPTVGRANLILQFTFGLQFTYSCNHLYMIWAYQCFETQKSEKYRESCFDDKNNHLGNKYFKNVDFNLWCSYNGATRYTFVVCMARIMYKWIADKSELKTESEL